MCIIPFLFTSSLPGNTPPPPPSNAAGLCLFCQGSLIARGKSKELETPVQGAKIQSLKVAQQPAQSQSLQLRVKVVKDKPLEPQAIDRACEVKAEHWRRAERRGPVPQLSLLPGG